MDEGGAVLVVELASVVDDGFGGGALSPELAAPFAELRRRGWLVVAEGGADIAEGLAEFDAVIPKGAAAEVEFELRRAPRGRTVRVAEAAYLSGSPASVAAARRAGFGGVFGLARRRGAARLRAAGADAVVADPRGVDAAWRRGGSASVGRRQRSVTTVPSALAASGALAERLAGKQKAVFLDYDGTLTPIVADPEAAALSPAMRHAVAELADQVFVAIVTGRDRRDIEERVGLPQLYYAGNHGFDIAGPHGNLEHPGGVAAIPALDAAERELRAALAAIPGAVVERKRYSLSLHYRLVPDSELGAFFARAREVTRAGLRQGEGKKVIELCPDVDWDKGRAMAWLLEEMDLDSADVVPVFVGDDLTDENAFAALGGDGVAVLAGDPGDRFTYADVRVMGEAEVMELLGVLAGEMRSDEGAERVR